MYVLDLYFQYDNLEINNKIIITNKIVFKYWWYYRLIIMDIKKLLVVAFIFIVVQSACTVNEIKNLVNNSLAFSGSVSSSASSSNNLYFLFYGVQGVT